MESKESSGGGEAVGLARGVAKRSQTSSALESVSARPRWSIAMLRTVALSIPNFVLYAHKADSATCVLHVAKIATLIDRDLRSESDPTKRQAAAVRVVRCSAVTPAGAVLAQS